MSKPLYIPIILGTNRENRQSENVAKLVHDALERHEETETTLFDVRDFKFPTDGYGQEIKDMFPEYRDAIIKADGLVIVAPEYNHAYPGILKSVLDLVLREYVHKAVGLVGVSAGPFGGTRVIESLVPVVRELGLSVTFTDVNFSQVEKIFDKNGKPKDPAWQTRVDGFIEELCWMAKTLRWGRENVPSMFHELN
jgi:NAD(P)H-dependent FMN reductase